MPLSVDITANFDLEVNYLENSEGLEGIWRYSSDLFDATTITRIAEHFENLLRGIVANPEARISELPLLRVAERDRSLVE
ncbi:condensation domain-containing protein [Tolypothrix bouteillei VB521301_2]|uniref:condensation domain-containing protein n=1 Tax=Tolypothrix bouteillei TaxID=1246981 RepID=UPI0038B49B5B